MEEHKINANLQRIAKEKAATMSAKKRILKARLEFGREASALAREFSSTKILGQEISKRFPASRKMDAALRSSCRWLHDALHQEGHPANDIMTVLQVSSIYDIGSENPVTIRRMYKSKKKSLEA